MAGSFKRWVANKRTVKYVAAPKTQSRLPGSGPQGATTIMRPQAKVKPMTLKPGASYPDKAIEMPRKTSKPAAKRIAPKSNMRSYGQKGYKPSTGKGVGY